MTFQRPHSVSLFVAAIGLAALGFAAGGVQTLPAPHPQDEQQRTELTDPDTSSDSDSGASTKVADQDKRNQQEAATRRLLCAQIVLIALVLAALPLGAWISSRGGAPEKRGLGLPRGSVRAMLALLIVGSTINEPERAVTTGNAK